jgi:primosomal protein N'
MRKMLVISLVDIRYICIKCQNCKAEVTLDMQAEYKLGKYGTFAPKQCPVCQGQYDSAIPDNADRLRKAYRAMLPIAAQITLKGDSVPA